MKTAFSNAFYDWNTIKRLRRSPRPLWGSLQRSPISPSWGRRGTPLPHPPQPHPPSSKSHATLSTILLLQCPIFGGHICQPLLQNTLPVSMVTMAMTYKNNENHQEHMDGPLAAAINGPIPHFLWATPPATRCGGALDTVFSDRDELQKPIHSLS